jgi:hypothetical protein
VTLKLADDYPQFKRICARHGIQISATRVRKVVKHFGPSANQRACGERSSSRRPRRCCASLLSSDDRAADQSSFLGCGTWFPLQAALELGAAIRRTATRRQPSER